MYWLIYLGTALGAVPSLLLFPSVLPRVLTWVMKMRRMKGSVGSAAVTFQFPLFLTLQVEEVRLTNPPGFGHENMVALRMARGTVNVWSLFTRCIKMGEVEVNGVDVFIEREEKLGINVSAYLRQMKGETARHDDDEEGVDSEQESHFVMSMLGMVDDGLDRVGGALTDAVEREGGIGNLAKHTTSDVLTGAVSTVSNIFGLVGKTAASQAKKLDASVKQAGGIDKLVVNTANSVVNSVESKTKEGVSSAKEGGFTGMASFATKNLTSAVGTVASGANDALLEEALHRHVQGCYQEQAKWQYVDLNAVRVNGLRVDARKLFHKEEEGNAVFEASQVVLVDRDLTPHPKALRAVGLPMPELQRRMQVKVNHQMRKQNTGAVFRTVTPSWLLPKKGKGTGAYVQGVGSGVAGVLTGAAKKGMSAVGGVGGTLAAAGKSGAAKAYESATSSLSASAVVVEKNGSSSSDLDEEGVVFVPSSEAGAGRGASSEEEGGGGARLEPSAGHAKASKVSRARDMASETVRGVSKTAESLSHIAHIGKEKAPAAIKGATDLLGGVIGGTGDAMSKATGARVFDDAGKTVAGAFDNVGGALGGLFGKKAAAKPKDASE